MTKFGKQTIHKTNPLSLNIGCYIENNRRLVLKKTVFLRGRVR